MSETGEAPSERLRERAEQSRMKLWFLLEADRWFVTGMLLAVVFLTLVGTGYLYPSSESAIRSSDSVDTLFQGLLTATITGVTLVLTLNQLVLSQEFGAVEDQRERMEGAMQFRSDVADTIRAPVSPSRPAQFLRALVQVSGDRARDLRDAVPDTIDETLAKDIDDFTASLIDDADRVSSGLDDARFGDFDVISSALNFNYSWKIFEGRRIRKRSRDTLGEEGTEALEGLIEVIQLFGPAREHFKTLYFQWDLINLSRRMLAVAIPAMLVSGSMVIFFNDSTYNVAIYEIDTLVAVIAGATTISVAPFLILLAYIMRIATITKHTLSIGPFILRDTEDVAEVEWNH